MPAPSTEIARRPRILEREAPLGYALVLPAMIYLALFIAYPFFMSLYLSLTDAQAGNQRWRWIGTANYSKVESHELLAEDLVLATFPDEAAARAFAALRGRGRLETTADPRGGTRARLVVG